MTVRTRTTTPRLVSFAVALLFATTAWAVPTIDFNIVAPSTGVVAYGGGATPLLGAQIAVDFVTGTGTPANAGSFACIDCVLNFQTGNFIGATPNSWIFAGALGSSSISIIGSVDTDGDAVADIGPSILLLGSFAGPQVSIDLLPGSALGIGLSVGAFLDIKNQELADFFGLPMTPYVGGLSLGWAGLAEPGAAILATPTDGLVRNTLLVPEPAATFLLGIGFLVAALRRRR